MRRRTGRKGRGGNTFEILLVLKGHVAHSVRQVIWPKGLVLIKVVNRATGDRSCCLAEKVEQVLLHSSFIISVKGCIMFKENKYNRFF